MCGNFLRGQHTSFSIRTKIMSILNIAEETEVESTIASAEFHTFLSVTTCIFCYLGTLYNFHLENVNLAKMYGNVNIEGNVSPSNKSV